MPTGHDSDKPAALVLNLGQETAGDGDSPEAMKFIVINQGGRLVMVHGPLKEYPYHASLIHEYCESYEIAAAWLKKPDLIEIWDPDVEMRGGGWLEVNRAAREVTVYGFSTAYGKYVPSDVQHILQSTDSFTGYRITFKS